MPPQQPTYNKAPQQALQEIVGYLNLSSGAHDAKFFANVDVVWRAIDTSGSQDCSVVATLHKWLQEKLEQLASDGGAFANVVQARAAITLLVERLLPAYRQHHRDLLHHQSECDLWRPFFLARAWQALLAQGGPWDEQERIVAAAIDELNNYIGYRPVATLQTQRHQPYRHEWVAPIPWYVAGAGVAAGRYEELLKRALGFLDQMDEELLRQAWFDPRMLAELSIDPRAYDFDHPASKRPNHQFGQWDPHAIDSHGYYHRFVLQQVTLDALLARCDRHESLGVAREELQYEAAAVLAGTILMASGTSGNRPECHDSTVTLSSLLPRIAAYRDEFYQRLLEGTGGTHGGRLRAEAAQLRQPFGGARQHLNQELAQRRARQLQQVHLAQLFARMGYPDAALEQAERVRVASARMVSQIYCRLTAGHQAIDAKRLADVVPIQEEIEQLVERAIWCGAVADPWNVIGFGGNFSLFPALENTVRDYRIDELLEMVEQILDLAARAWSEAAALDDAALEAKFSAALRRLSQWWDQYATTTVESVEGVSAHDVEVSANLVAGALNAWHKAGAAAGDVAFWRLFVDQFDSPKAFQLVIESLLEKRDRVASMALMMQWISQAERTPLEEGDSSWCTLAKRWLRSVGRDATDAADDLWPLVEKFFLHLEASAEDLWEVPTFALAKGSSPRESSSNQMTEQEALADDLGNLPDDADDLYSAAYEHVVYRDSSDDGIEGQIVDDGPSQTEYELQQEAQRLLEHLQFLKTVADLWKQTAVCWTAAVPPVQKRGRSLASWQADAHRRQDQLIKLLDVVHQYPLSPVSGSHEALVQYDRQRMIRDHLLEEIIATCVKMTDAAQWLEAASRAHEAQSKECSKETPERSTITILEALLVGDRERVVAGWQVLTDSLLKCELLYLPLLRGGHPRDIVRARALQQLLTDLFAWLPRLGLVREACQLVDVTQSMEARHPLGDGAVTEFDRLFETGFKAVVEAVIASADLWDQEGKHVSGDRSSDGLLVDVLQRITELQLQRWLQHSRTLRLSVVEKLASEQKWKRFVSFVDRYGGELFTQKFLNLGNVRAILHQGVDTWLVQLEQEADDEGPSRLMADLDHRLDRDEAIEMLSLSLEMVAENYREYRDYNSTTTQSDDGGLLHSLADFLRLRAAYDRVAWNLHPVILAHEILVRQNRLHAAELWHAALAERTSEAADDQQKRLHDLAERNGMCLPTVSERIGERFVRPLVIDRIRAMVAPAIEAAADGEEGQAFSALTDEIASISSEPAGAGLDVPDWLLALEEEVSRVRLRLRHQESEDDLIRPTPQVCLGWEELQRQIGDLTDCDLTPPR